MDNSKYMTIFETLQRELCEGKYGANNPFPSETQLVRRFKVSRFTAVRAVRKLEDEGLVVRRRGKGSFPTNFAKTAAGPVGIIMPGLAYGEIFAPICAEITKLCQQNGRTVLLGNTATAEPQERAEASKRMAADFVRQRVAGVIMHPIEYLRDSAGANLEIANILQKAGVPVVLLDYDIFQAPKRSGYDLVGIDNYGAGRRMGEHLIECGAKRVLFVKRRNCAPTVDSRLLGLAAAMISAGKSWSAANVIECEPGSEEAIIRRLRGRNAPDAIVCGYDLHAASVLKAIEKSMRKGTVPERIMLAGFDDVQIASVMSPALTTVRQPCREIARVAVEMLHRRMKFPDSPVCTMVLDAPLVVRESTSRKRSASER